MPSEDERSASVTAGWQRRVLAKIGGSATVGFAAGALLSLLSRGRAASAAAAAPAATAAAAAAAASSSSLPRAAPWAVRTAGSCAVCAAAYALPLEGVRAVRQRHSPLNSAVAGGLAAGVLSSVHRSGGGGGRGGGGAVPFLFAASVGAAVAASLHAGGDWATGGRGLARPVLEGLGLLDPPRRLVREREAKASAAAEEAERQREQRLRQQEASSSSPSSSSPASIEGEALHPWLEWLPIRKLTPEEAALRKRLKEEEFRKNARLAAEGGMPAAAAAVGKKGKAQ